MAAPILWAPGMFRLFQQEGYLGFSGQIFAENRRFLADSPLLLETQAFGGRRKLQKTENFRRKPQETADWALSP